MIRLEAQRMEREYSEIAALLAAGAELARCRTEGEACRQVVQSAVQFLGLRRCAIFLRSEDSFRGAWAADRNGGLRDISQAFLPQANLPPAGWFEELATGGPRWTLLEETAWPIPDPRDDDRQAARIVATVVSGPGCVTPDALILNEAPPPPDGPDAARQEALAALASLLGEVMARISDARATARCEEKLRHAERMEAQTRMAAAVAHDLNNLIMPVIGYSKHLCDALSGNPAAEADAREILRAGEEISEIATRLLRIGRRNRQSNEAVEIGRLIEEHRARLAGLLEPDITLTVSTPPAGLPPACADAGSFLGMLQALIENAREALPHGGAVRIDADTVQLDACGCREQVFLQPGRYVRLRIEDTGTGMKEEERLRAFDPFFTTHRERRAAGLGLSYVYSTVRQCGGSVELFARPGGGTRVDLHLPAADNTGICAPGGASPPGGSETVLVIQPVDSIRQLLSSSLTTLGYRVLAAASLTEGRALAGQAALTIHLVLLPAPASGRPTAREDLALGCPGPSPRLLYLLEQGDTPPPRAPGVDLLRKPFTCRSLGDRVRILLDREMIP